ncbi:MAG: ferredoxin, partial [Firmicutes bacterium]|nr:ferredoxin [Bacillota bacterium]
MAARFISLTAKIQEVRNKLPAKENSATILQNRVLVEAELDPVSQKQYVVLEPPGLSNNQADIDRLLESLSNRYPGLTVPLPLMNQIGDILRRSGWRVTATVSMFEENWRLVDVEEGDTTGKQYGLAVDLGTTTVVGYLVDL